MELHNLPHDAVGTLADHIKNLVLLTGVEVAGSGVGGCSHFRDGVAQALCDSRKNGGRVMDVGKEEGKKKTGKERKERREKRVSLK